MKKVTLFAVAAIAALSMSSCKKDRTCTCTDTPAGGGTASTSTVVVTKATKKGAAGGACWSGTQVYTVSGTSYTSTRSCTIK